MPRLLPLCSALAGWLVAPGLAVADAEKIDCGNAQSTYEINACADKEFSSADAELNAAYQAALKAVPQFAAGEKPYDARSWEQALRASQRAWVAYRDAECKDHVAMFWTGGSGASADIIGCMTEMTRARTKRLKDRYETR